MASLDDAKEVLSEARKAVARGRAGYEAGLHGQLAIAIGNLSDDGQHPRNPEVTEAAQKILDPLQVWGATLGKKDAAVEGPPKEQLKGTIEDLRGAIDALEADAPPT